MSFEKLIPDYYPNLHPVFLACRNGEVELVQQFLESGVKADVDGGNHPSLIATAIDGGYSDIVDLLLSHGIDPNCRLNRFGQRPLIRAINARNPRVVDLLITRGAGINVSDDFGFTPLHAAAAGKNYDCIRMLLDHGAAIEARHRGGCTPFFEAARNDNSEGMRILSDAGCDTEARANGGTTPLIIAAQAGRADAISWLLEYGANLNAEESEHKTALDWATANGHQKVVELLESRIKS